MIVPHEFLVWDLNAPVICIGTDLDFDILQVHTSGSTVCIDETYEPDRRRTDIF